MSQTPDCPGNGDVPELSAVAACPSEVVAYPNSSTSKSRASNLAKRKPLSPTVTFEDVGYSLPEGKCHCIRRNGRLKTILQGVSGILGPGLNAILGPTGSGKTTLLDILAGRKDRQHVTGEIRMNGEISPKDLQHQLGYVVQDDMLMGTLSVRENLQFSASLRLPKSYSWKDKWLVVEEVIKELRLTQCANTKIGTEYTRGVSGGEKKRTSIGMELVTSPSILCLDEPTTGLDACAAVSVMQLLKELAAAGRTIIFSIHQPRYAIYKLFDTVTLLSQGTLVYHGEASQTLHYFASIGHECEMHNNPADLFLDVIYQYEESSQQRRDKKKKRRKNRGPHLSTPPQSQEVGDVEAIEGVEQSTVSLHDKFRCSDIYEALVSTLRGVASDSFEGDKLSSVERQGSLKQAKYASSFLRQLLVVSKRTILNVLRSPQVLVMQVFTMILLAVIVGIIYFQLDDNPSPFGFTNRLGAFFFMVLNMVYTNMSAVDLFIRQKPLFIHENASGYYRVSAFFLAKTFLDLLPIRLLPVTLYAAISYGMIGLRPEVSSFFIYLLTLLLTVSVSSSLAFAVSAVVRLTAIANLIVALVFVFAMLFGGFIINLLSLTPWLSWLQYLSAFRYSMAALAVNELKDRYFCQFNSTLVEISGLNTTSCTTGVLVEGNVFLQDFGYLNFDLWYNEAALLLMAILLLVLAYINLRLINKRR